MKLLSFLWLLPACAAPEGEFVTLSPYPNPFGWGDALYAAQPHRQNPLEVVISGETAWVSLQGSADEPEAEVAAVDLQTRTVTGRARVGSNTTGLTVGPDGRIYAFGRFSNWISIIDPSSLAVERVPGEFYDVEGVFTPDGQLWVTNRAADAVRVLDAETLNELARLPVDTNPRDIAVSPDGTRVAVASITGLGVRLFDSRSWEEVARVGLGAPANGLAWAGDWLVVATLSASTHHLPHEGHDGDGDGAPGDGTPNTNFQDLQNELVVTDREGVIAHRYTSDTLCCRDFRDVDPDDTALSGDLQPPRETWIVGGALPEQVAATADGRTVWVTYSASNELQSFRVDPGTGALAPGLVLPTGHNPHGVAVTDGIVVVAHRLGETLGIRDGDGYAEVEVGDLAGGPFPATDAETGELFNFVTAPFTVDGDQSCAHCHREGGNLDKALSMPLGLAAGRIRRMVMAYRGAADTRPWFFEGAMDETNFRPVINEFARVENFCCEDPTLWPDGAPADCATHPPAECTTEPNPYTADTFDPARLGGWSHPRPTAAVTRDAFFLAAAAEVLGRHESFGDSVYYEDLVTGERAPLPLNLETITRSLGVFLLHDTGLLPNPNSNDSEAVRRGEALFARPDVGCANCHPSPAFTVSTDHDTLNGEFLFLPVVSPDRDASGINLDLLSDGFMTTFPSAEQQSCEELCGEEACAEDNRVCDRWRDLSFSAPSLRGIWDRAPSMLHDGRARGLREVLATPGHPVLQPGERGFNERDGVPDTHGGTSHLSASEVEDLIAFLETL